MRRIAPTARALIALMSAGLVLLPIASANAQTSASLEVASVDGRTVNLMLTLDPRLTVAADSPTKGTVQVDGTVIPATTQLEIAEDTRPDTAILVLDASGSMAGARIEAARRAATGFIEAMRPEVAIGLVTFNNKVRTAVAPTTDREALLSAIAKVKPSDDTSLYDAIAKAEAQVPEGARARLVVLSDGQDTSSKATLADTEQRVTSSGIPVDVVSIKPTAAQLAALKGIANAGSGTVRTATTSDDLLQAFVAASTNFGARVRVAATLPDEVDGMGRPITATVAIGSDVVEGATVLPDAQSLSAAGGAASVVGDSLQSTIAPSLLRDLVLPIVLGLLVTLALFTIVLVFVNVRRRARSTERIDQVMQYRTGAQHTSATLARTLEEQPTFMDRLDSQLAKVSNTRRTAARLSAAEFALSPAGWLLIRIAVGLLALAVIGLLVRSALIGLVAGIAFAWLIPSVVLQMRVARRQRAFADALPDFLMLLASGLRAGLSFTHALDSAAEEDKGEVGRQVRRALREVQVGATLDDALMECASRMDNEDLRWTVTAISVQREVGGNLSAILDSAAATIKSRYELRREVRTLSAEGRLSAYVLVALPLGVFAFLAVFRREYVSLLWTDPLGIVMLVGLALVMLVGWLWMRAIVRIKV